MIRAFIIILLYGIAFTLSVWTLLTTNAITGGLVIFFTALATGLLLDDIKR
jgi:hypothetical protein